jgi:hypothetical protein
MERHATSWAARPPAPARTGRPAGQQRHAQTERGHDDGGQEDGDAGQAVAERQPEGDGNGDEGEAEDDQLAPEESPGRARAARRRDGDAADEGGGGGGDEHAGGEAAVEGAGGVGDEGDGGTKGQRVKGDGPEDAERHRTLTQPIRRRLLFIVAHEGATIVPFGPARACAFGILAAPGGGRCRRRRARRCAIPELRDTLRSVNACRSQS